LHVYIPTLCTGLLIQVSFVFYSTYCKEPLYGGNPFSSWRPLIMVCFAWAAQWGLAGRRFWLLGVRFFFDTCTSSLGIFGGNYSREASHLLFGAINLLTRVYTITTITVFFERRDHGD
jgi:hypothetical protein